jgi:hypothetical protein
MTSQHEILGKIREGRERLVALGVSAERRDEYYSQLSAGCVDPDTAGER